MRTLGAVFMALTLAAAAQAEIKTKAIDYKHGDVVLEGYMVWDDARKGPQPGVLLVHEWWGVTEHTKSMTRQVAEMGYVAFALDMYGKDVVTDSVDQAGKLAGQFKGNPALMRDRAKAGFDEFTKQPEVDKSRVAAIGFCFGGTTVLNMAYSGLALRGVVSFHGGLVPPMDADRGNVKAKILVLHGADDPLVPDVAIKTFQDGVRKAKADWQMVYYGNAVHSFTNPAADKVGIDGVKYDAATDKRSRGHIKVFFDEVLAKTK
ncbi:MAG: dienelactone hydrolase family protein [Phycisphaerae bacterium]